MTTEQLKLAVKAQTLLEVFEHSDVGTQLLRQAKECIDKLIEADKKSDCITAPGLRGLENYDLDRFPYTKTETEQK